MIDYVVKPLRELDKRRSIVCYFGLDFASPRLAESARKDRWRRHSGGCALYYQMQVYGRRSVSDTGYSFPQEVHLMTPVPAELGAGHLPDHLRRRRRTALELLLARHDPHRPVDSRPQRRTGGVPETLAAAVARTARRGPGGTVGYRGTFGVEHDAVPRTQLFHNASGRLRDPAGGGALPRPALAGLVLGKCARDRAGRQKTSDRPRFRRAGAARGRRRS